MYDFNVISLGAGVQSSVMALLAAEGAIEPMPDAAIFADTGWEPAAIYEHLAWLEDVLPFPVLRVSKGDIRDDSLTARSTAASGEYAGRWVAMPWYTRNADGSKGMIRRQCTKEYKLEPIRQGVRQVLGIGPRDGLDGRRVSQWIGISTDELVRCKDSGVAYIDNRWPLIELGWNRAECRAWFASRFPGRPLVRSACIGCPYRKQNEWQEMRQRAPAEFEDACAFDEGIRHAAGMMGESYTHPSLKPLREAVEDQAAQIEFGFDQECDGMCGI